MTGTVKLVSAGGGSVSMVTPSTGSNRTVTFPDADVNQLSDATLTTQGDILYRDGSGLQRLAPAGASRTLKMNSSNNAPEWVSVSAGYTKLIDKQGVGTGTSYDVTSIPAGVSHVVILHHAMSFGGADDHCIRLGKSAGLVTSTDYFSSEKYADNAITTTSNNNRFGGYGTGSAARTFSGVIDLWHLGSNTWQLAWTHTTPQLTGSNTSQIYQTCGYVSVGGTLDRFSYFGHTGGSLDGGEISVYYI